MLRVAQTPWFYPNVVFTGRVDKTPPTPHVNDGRAGGDGTQRGRKGSQISPGREEEIQEGTNPTLLPLRIANTAAAACISASASWEGRSVRTIEQYLI